MPDAGGEPDAGEPDAGEPDAGEPDAGEPDAGEPDAGEPDAGEPDGGAPDSGDSPDSGEPDAGELDAGWDGGLWQTIETACDGFDNDGDGRIDVSRPFTILSGIGAVYGHQARSFGDGVALLVHGHSSTELVFVDRRGIVERRASVAAAGFLDGFVPNWSTSREPMVITWSQRAADAGFVSMHAAVWDPDGGLVPVSSSDGGLSGELYRGPELNVAPRAHVRPGGACFLASWTNACDGWARVGMTFRVDGTISAGPTPLKAAPFASCSVSWQYGLVETSDGFAFPALSGLADGGLTVELASFDCELTDAGIKTFARTEQPGLHDPPFARNLATDGGDDIWVIAANSTRGTALAWAINRGPEMLAIVPDAGEAILTTSVYQTPRGTVSTWTTYSGTAFARNLSSGEMLQFGLGGTTREWTQALVPNEEYFLASATADAGNGLSELRGTFFCAP